MSREYTDFEEGSNRAKGTARPKLRTAGTRAGGLSETKWAMPKIPGGPRRIFTPLGPRVKVRVQGNV